MCPTLTVPDFFEVHYTTYYIKISKNLLAKELHVKWDEIDCIDFRLDLDRFLVLFRPLSNVVCDILVIQNTAFYDFS